MPIYLKLVKAYIYKGLSSDALFWYTNVLHINFLDTQLHVKCTLLVNTAQIVNTEKTNMHNETRPIKDISSQ